MAPHDKDFDDDPKPPDPGDRPPAVKTRLGEPLSIPTTTSTTMEPEASSDDFPWTHQSHGPYYSYYTGGPPPWVETGGLADGPTSSTWTTAIKPTALENGGITQSPPVALPTMTKAPPPSIHPGGYESNGPGKLPTEDRMSSGGVLAATAITPIVVLALIGAIVLFCMRKRKRQKLEKEAAQKEVQEMKMQPQNLPTCQPYMASAPAASAGHLMSPSSPFAPPPVILGPIPSGANGAYFTGIDTSDVISITSASIHRQGPATFSDIDSLAEPPPPYRPRSAAPPSLTNTSRHSSFRASMSPPATSRTQLLERSPFDDPDDGDDMISDISGPTARRSVDALSAVSDLSYQHDPVVNKLSL